MAQTYDHIVHLKGIETNVIDSINDRDSIDDLIDKGNFREVKTVPGITIYINEEQVVSPQSMMIALKNGQMVYKMNTMQ